jgi:adenine-specific DNA-methyltransferase
VDGAIKFPKEDWLDDKTRRRLGMTYTPGWIVEEMVRWAKQYGNPARVVDPGAGTGPFTFAAAEAFQTPRYLRLRSSPRAPAT